VRGSTVLLAAGLLVAGALSGCTDEPRSDVAGRRDDRFVVASFDFTESRLLAEIYAQALEADGVEVRREMDLGPRELVLPALRQGFVDAVP
jgi:osmoprotectant transport system substrate-binding protein